MKYRVTVYGFLDDELAITFAKKFADGLPPSMHVEVQDSNDRYLWSYPEKEPEPPELPLAEALKLPYLQDSTARVDEADVVWHREYRRKSNGIHQTQLDGCMRCQNGLHWQCHGCSCPCNAAPFDAMSHINTEETKKWLDAVRRIGPYWYPPLVEAEK